MEFGLLIPCNIWRIQGRFQTSKHINNHERIKGLIFRMIQTTRSLSLNTFLCDSRQWYYMNLHDIHTVF